MWGIWILTAAWTCLNMLEHMEIYGISNMKVICNYIIVRAKWSHSLSKRVIQTISWRLSLNFFCGQHHNFRYFSKAMDVEIRRKVTSHQMVTMQRRIPSIYPWKAWLGVADWIGSPKIELSPSSFTQIVSNKPGPKSHIWGKPIFIRLFTIRGNKWIFWINLKMKKKDHKRALPSENPWRKELAFPENPCMEYLPTLTPKVI